MTVTDVPPVITVDKQNVQINGSTAIVAPGGSASYSITITNGPNAIEPITLTAVTDTLSTSGGGFGPTGDQLLHAWPAPVTATTCSNYVGTVLAIGEFVTCQFTIDTTQVGPLAEGDVLTNRVDVTAVDDDGTEVSGSATASRTVLGEPPSLDVFKTDNDAVIRRAGREHRLRPDDHQPQRHRATDDHVDHRRGVLRRRRAASLRIEPTARSGDPGDHSGRRHQRPAPTSRFVSTPTATT